MTASKRKRSRATVEAEAARLHAFVQRENWRAARPLAARLRRIEPQRPDLQFLAAHIAYRGDNDAERAERILAGLIAENPRHLSARMLRAVTSGAQGRRDQAVAELEHVLTADPSWTSALYELVRADPSAGPALLPRIEAALADPALSRLSRAELQNAQGLVADRQDDTIRAFDAFATSNETLANGYDAAASTQLFAAVRMMMSEQAIAAAAKDGAEDDRMVFIIGMPRSGSTLIEQILAAHPEAAACGERPEMAQLLCEATQDGALAGLPAAYGPQIAPLAMRPKQRRQLAQRYLEALQPVARRHGARRWIDKMPANLPFCGAIAALLPKARFILTDRNPLDTAWSCFSTYFSGPQGFSESLDRLAHHSILSREYARHWRAVLGERVIEMRYEDLVADLEGGARRLVAHVGLDWRPACAAPHQSRSTVTTASMAQVRQPVTAGSIGRWRRYERQMTGLADAFRQYEDGRTLH